LEDDEPQELEKVRGADEGIKPGVSAANPGKSATERIINPRSG